MEQYLEIIVSNNEYLNNRFRRVYCLHLTEALVKRGHKVKALVKYNSFNSWGWLEQINKDVLKNIEVITGDVRDEYLIRQIIKKKVDVVKFSCFDWNTYRASKSV